MINRKNIKTFSYYFILILGLVLVLLMIIKICTLKTTIIIDRNDETENRLAVLKKEASELRDGSCKDFINEYIEMIDKSYFEGEVKLKEIYDHYWNTPTVNYYQKSMEACNIGQDEIKKTQLPSKFVGTMVLPDLIFYKYMFAYEIDLKDEYRAYIEPSVDNISLQTLRNNQLNLLEDYINIYKSKVNDNEE